MGLLEELKGMMSGSGTQSPDDVSAAFQQVASGADHAALSQGLAEAF
jgi:hypothetical protein